MISEIKIDEALMLQQPVIDVRSPGEFEKGHIPGAHNMPLFSDEERAHIGTVYKKQSKEAAIKWGHTYSTPKLQYFIQKATQIAPDATVIVHCWRGGMRSRAMAQHLSDNGFNAVHVIEGGYKAYRNYVLNQLGTTLRLVVLGGYTGSGKTHILQELKKRGHQVIDLEGLAHHKGSAFGGIGQLKQPSVEQFENNLQKECSLLNPDEHIWVEDESHNIGSVVIPAPFFTQMRNTRLYFIDIPKTERAKHLVTEYASCNSQQLADSLQRIAKRLGGQHVQKAIQLLEEENYYEVALIALRYYDKSYLTAMGTRVNKEVVQIPLPAVNHYNNALEIEKQLKNHE